MSEDWESRAYSFNASWGKGERMASMRNGSGDDWFILFCSAGTFVKSFWHEYKPKLTTAALYAGLPKGLAHCLEENAFSTDLVTFGGWHDGTWTLRGDPKPMAEELLMLSGEPEAYRSFVSGYFEIEVPVEPVAHLLAGKKLSAKLLSALGSERTLAEMKDDLAEIGYGT